MLMIFTHILFAIGALFFGFYVLIRKKGTKQHKLFGWFWVFLMTYVALSSFWIKELNNGHFSWIHVLSIWTLFTLTSAIIAIKNKKVNLHKVLMVGNFVGLSIAGIFTLLPGRFIPKILGLF